MDCTARLCSDTLWLRMHSIRAAMQVSTCGATAQVFVANPNKTQEITELLQHNKDKLLRYLGDFHTDKGGFPSCQHCTCFTHWCRVVTCFMHHLRCKGTQEDSPLIACLVSVLPDSG